MEGCRPPKPPPPPPPPGGGHPTSNVVPPSCNRDVGGRTKARSLNGDGPPLDGPRRAASEPCRSVARLANRGAVLHCIPGGRSKMSLSWANEAQSARAARPSLILVIVPPSLAAAGCPFDPIRRLAAARACTLLVAMPWETAKIARLEGCLCSSTLSTPIAFSSGTWKNICNCCSQTTKRSGSRSVHCRSAAGIDRRGHHPGRPGSGAHPSPRRITG